VNDLFNITVATTFGSILFLLSVRFFFGEISYPRSIFIIDWFLNIFLMGGIRLLRRLHEKTGEEGASKKRVIVIGAGHGAEMLLRDIEHSHYCPYDVIGLIDDNPAKKGLKIRNVPILGTRKELPSLIESEDPEEFLIAMPSASPSLVQSIVEDLRQYGRPIKFLPGFLGILSGRDSLSKIKVMEPEDVLFRAPTSYKDMDKNMKLNDFIKGKRVMITGAGGSIGSEISRQIAFFNPENLILFERHEESLYRLDMELRSLTTDISFLTSIIGDITEENKVIEVMERFQPEIIFHTAAYKHVPLMENNPYEAFKINVMGTNMVAERARDFGVERFINVSTDKAVNPTNVMGITKKIAEEMVRYLSEDGKMGRWEDENLKIYQPHHNSTKYITVRFGNVLETSGSVIPLFKEQIQQGIPVTVTHPEVTRYFMTKSEAANLVLQAAVMGSGGEVFVLDMGEPIKILELAKRMITLYGYKPGVDIDISFIGLRPGEKLHEELFNSDEIQEKTSNPKINKAISNGRGIKYIGVIK
jgi:FlaA1/EpsC-like NDP-sugar epimerase